MARARNIRPAIWHKVRALPCAVCGLEGWTVADHIRPVAHGGGPEESNLQPLCHFCNARKGCRLTNAELVEWVLGRGLQHFTLGTYRAMTRRDNPYSGPGEREWLRRNPEKHARARALFVAFIERHLWPRA